MSGMLPALPTASPPLAHVAMCCPRACRERCLMFLLQLPINAPRYGVLRCSLSSQLSVVLTYIPCFCGRWHTLHRNLVLTPSAGAVLQLSSCRTPKLHGLPALDEPFQKDWSKGEKCHRANHAARGEDSLTHPWEQGRDAPEVSPGFKVHLPLPVQI